MLTTSRSLLDRLRNGTDPQAWHRWLVVYEPWLRKWLARLQPTDRDDVIQDVLAAVHQKLSGFVHNGRPGAFRAWLKAILVNKTRRFLEKRGQLGERLPDWLDNLEDPSSELSRRWDAEHDEQLVRRLLALVRLDFTPRTWEVFCLLVLENRSAAELALLCQMELNAVYVAKSRVLARLREEMTGLIGE